MSTQQQQQQQQGAATAGPLIRLSSADNEEFEVPLEIACMAATIKNLVDDIGADAEAPIPVPNVSSRILKMVLTYCSYHYEHPVPQAPEDPTRAESRRTDDIIPWDKTFCDVDQATLFELVLAANFLDIRPLLDLTCKTIANMIKGKTPEQIRQTFNIKNDFTPEEEEQIMKENEWNEER
jgi:S-phase kinase-associated protein 1